MRYAFRCKNCLSVIFLDTDTAKPSIYLEAAKAHELYFAFVGKMQCLCDGYFEEMGKVDLERDKDGVVVATELRAPCDARCTNALGPKCTCRCCCANHGSGRLVEVDRVTYRIQKADGVITDEAIAAGRRYAEHLAVLDERNAQLSRTLRAGWNYDVSRLRHSLLTFLRKIKQSRSLKHRTTLVNDALTLIKEPTHACT